MPDNGNGEFRGATRAQIEHLRDQIREVRQDLREVSTAIHGLESFRSRVLALAGAGAAVATLLVQFLMDKLGGGS